MNILQPWNVFFLVGFVVYSWIRHVFIERTRGEKKAVSRFDGLEKILLTAMVPPILLLPVLYLFTPLLAFADYRLPMFVPWIGAATMVASLWLFWRSHTDLGQNWSVSIELRENHELVTQGVYRYVRHPMYASIWLWGVAQGMLLQNWFAGWSVLPAFAAMYLLRTPREEQLMCELFGEEYREYMRRTGRLCPRIRIKRAD
ncbi:MAG: isoprenylcysteine carboxylmethyltransferase family protein [Planctomycetes bacterium]|nr:isoprenylcysteine carboxylmethyltransferase family protein [Planctomycetota bacterium]